MDRDDSTERLIGHNEKSTSYKDRRSSFLRSHWIVIAHTLAIILYGTLGILLAFRFNSNTRSGQQLIFSPANVAIEYEQHVFTPGLLGDPEYFGLPGEAVDRAWSKLLYPSSIYLTEEERRNYDHQKPIVKMSDGNYLGQLMVYHELHCLKRLYQFLHPEHYFPNLTAKERTMNARHTEHCLATLRQGVMCHGDVSVMTMVWGKHSRIPLGDFANPHQCVNFDKLHDWAMGRAVVNGVEPGVLVHPKLGASFPDGHGTKIGFDDGDIDQDGNIITLND